ncbi:BOI-related E3 ubiquitin-protein ligase [Forsythia ovata]|uniref:BOI-related E3 ubiquitin-protein ligase n=1 Tax=Forsythia ovata TaxID=205694 RepID=A0ABD1WMY2_9LAMI
MPFYGHINPSQELLNGIQTSVASANMADGNVATAATASTKNRMPDAHQKILNQGSFYLVQKAVRRNAELEAWEAQLNSEIQTWQERAREQETTADALRSQLQQASIG